MGQRLSYRIETHYLAAPFRISGYVFEASELVVVELADDQYRGRGEAGGVYYLGDEAPRIVEQLEASRSAIEGCCRHRRRPRKVGRELVNQRGHLVRLLDRNLMAAVE